MNSGEKFIADFKADISKTESIFSKFSNNKKRKGVQIDHPWVRTTAIKKNEKRCKRES